MRGDIPHLSRGCPGAALAAHCAHRAESQELSPVTQNAPCCHSARTSLCPAVYTLRSDLVKGTTSFVMREVWSAAQKSTVNPALSRKCLLSYPGASGQRTEGVGPVSRGGSKPCKSPQKTKPGTSVDKGWARASALASLEEGKPRLKMSGNEQGDPGGASRLGRSSLLEWLAESLQHFPGEKDSRITS